jgi:hypothetical protein
MHPLQLLQCAQELYMMLLLISKMMQQMNWFKEVHHAIAFH